MTCEVRQPQPNLFRRHQDDCDGFLEGRPVCSKDKGRAYHPAVCLFSPAIFLQQLLVPVFEVFLHLNYVETDSSVQRRR
jgi:hypothetical protein